MTARFGEKDARDILEILDRLSRANTGEELMQQFLGDLADVIPSLSASFNWFAQGRLNYYLHPPLPSEIVPDLEQIMLRNWRQNPLVEHFRTTDDPRALRWRDLVDISEWHRSPLYREFYQPLGIRDQLGLQMPSPPGVSAALVVNGDRPFEDRDAAVLARLGPPVFARLTAIDNHESMRVALGGLGWSTLLVDDDGRVIGDLSPPVEKLVDDDRRILEELRAAVFDANASLADHGSHSIETPQGSVQLIFARNTMPPHALFVSTPQKPDDTATVSAFGKAGLSLREIDVANLMRHGAPNSVIAHQLDISIGTVKKHLERIYRTLGVSNRTAAAHALRQLLGEKREI